MTTEPNPPRGGAAGMLFLFCAAFGGVALAFDLMTHQGRGFWIGAEPGARALIGVAAALFVILAGHVVRLVLARGEKGGRDASDHS